MVDGECLNHFDPDDAIDGFEVKEDDVDGKKYHCNKCNFKTKDRRYIKHHVKFVCGRKYPKNNWQLKTEINRTKDLKDLKDENHTLKIENHDLNIENCDLKNLFEDLKKKSLPTYKLNEDNSFQPSDYPDLIQETKSKNGHRILLFDYQEFEFANVEGSTLTTSSLNDGCFWGRSKKWKTIYTKEIGK